MRVRWGGIGLVLLGIVAGTALLVAVTPMGRYLAHGAWEEAKILKRRQSIARLVADSSTPAPVRAKLQLVLEARRFAQDSLGLPAKDAFTQFTQLDHDTLVLVLSGAERDRLVPVTWWFPVVGRVPYRGYFDFDEAKREERELRDRGYDAYLRPSPAFSTLGFFNDPLLSTTLGEDSVSVVETVIHELTHNRFYMKGQAVFNESFASFVGARGTIEFFRARADTASVRMEEVRWSDDLLLGQVWEMAYRSLDSAYRANPGDSARGTRIVARDTVYGRVRRFLVDSVGPRLRFIDPRYAERVRLDNAALLARRIYATGLGDFERVWRQEGSQVRGALLRVIEIARERREAPFDTLRGWGRASP